MICTHATFTGTQVEKEDEVVTTAYCNECKALLYTRRTSKASLSSKTEYDDYIYGLLYTKLGRRSLCNFAVKTLGIEVPGCWIPEDPFYRSVVEDLAKGQRK